MHNNRQCLIIQSGLPCNALFARFVTLLLLLLQLCPVLFQLLVGPNCMSLSLLNFNT
jgi:hypothetical protein